MENYPPQFYGSLLNLMGSHDVVRAITALAGAPDRDSLTREQQAAYSPTIEQLKAGRKRFMAAAAVQYMMPGAPCLYYGDEAGRTPSTGAHTHGVKRIQNSSHISKSWESCINAPKAAAPSRGAAMYSRCTGRRSYAW